MKFINFKENQDIEISKFSKIFLTQQIDNQNVQKIFKKIKDSFPYLIEFPNNDNENIYGKVELYYDEKAHNFLMNLKSSNNMLKMIIRMKDRVFNILEEPIKNKLYQFFINFANSVFTHLT